MYFFNLAQTLQDLHNIKSLKLTVSNHTHFKQQGFCELLRTIKTYQYLRSVDITITGLLRIFEDQQSVQIFQTLDKLEQFLGLDEHQHPAKLAMSDEEMITFSEGLLSLHGLRSLALTFSSDDNLTNEGVHRLCCAVVKLHSLEGLFLTFDCCESLGEQSLHELVQTLKGMEHLSRVELSSNSAVGAKGKQILLEKGGGLLAAIEESTRFEEHNEGGNTEENEEQQQKEGNEDEDKDDDENENENENEDEDEDENEEDEDEKEDDDKDEDNNKDEDDSYQEEDTFSDSD